MYRKKVSSLKERGEFIRNFSSRIRREWVAYEGRCTIRSSTLHDAKKRRSMAGHHARWEWSFREIRPRASLRYPLLYLHARAHTHTHACETFQASSIGWTAKKLGGFFAIYPGKRTGSTVCSMGLNLTRNNLTTYGETIFTDPSMKKEFSFIDHR